MGLGVRFTTIAYQGFEADVEAALALGSVEAFAALVLVDHPPLQVFCDVVSIPASTDAAFSRTSWLHFNDVYLNY